MPNVKVQIPNQAQMSNPPTPPLLKGGEGGLSVDFELFNSFDIWIFHFDEEIVEFDKTSGS
jgi:hypothetical protein